MVGHRRLFTSDKGAVVIVEINYPADFAAARSPVEVSRVDVDIGADVAHRLAVVVNNADIVDGRGRTAEMVDAVMPEEDKFIYTGRGHGEMLFAGQPIRLRVEERIPIQRDIVSRESEGLRIHTAVAASIDGGVVGY